MISRLVSSALLGKLLGIEILRAFLKCPDQKVLGGKVQQYVFLISPASKSDIYYRLKTFKLEYWSRLFRKIANTFV